MLSEQDKAAKEAARLNDERYLIVKNLLNDVPEWQVAQCFRRDIKDVREIFRYVMAKVNNYLFALCKPPIACETISDAKRSRANILAILPKLNLDVRPKFSRIVSEAVTPSNYESAVNDIRR